MDNILGRRMKERRKQLGLSVDQLSELTEIGRSTLYRYEKNSDNVPFVMVPGIAKALKCSVDYLMGWDNQVEALVEVVPLDQRTIPMLGEIACGRPKTANEQHEYVTAGSGIDADFALICKGDSMIGARIHDGDIVFIKKMEMVENGEIAAVIIDDEATLKRVYYDQKESELRLVAENPAYKTLTFFGSQLDSIRILGKAVAFQSAL